MESHEVTIGKDTFPVRAVQNLCGHSIGPYQIHAGKSVPIVKGGPQTKMEEGELFAIETFGSTGKGRVFEGPDCSHYMKDFNHSGQVPLRNPKSKALLAHITNHFGTLAWCRRWIEDAFPKHFAPLRELVNSGILTPYPPLNDVAGSHVA
jgi:methionyl aminopeptidase